MTDAEGGAGPVAGARLPDFLIIGSPKSGTTSLAAWLGAHPDVFVPPQKELHFFSRDDRWALGPDWYASEFAPAGRRLAGEATPNYLDDEAVAPRLADTVPDARLIAIVREPVERAWSHHCYDRDLGIDSTPFEQIAAGAGGPDEHRYVRQGRYVRHLRRFADLVPREHTLVLLFDDLRDEPEATWRQVCSFLGISADPVPAAVGTVHNRHYTVRFPRVREAMVRWRAWKRLPFGIAPRLDRLLRSERPYDELSPALREQLRATYAADNSDLAVWLRRALPEGWRR